MMITGVRARPCAWNGWTAVEVATDAGLSSDRNIALGMPAGQMHDGHLTRQTGYLDRFDLIE